MYHSITEKNQYKIRLIHLVLAKQLRSYSIFAIGYSANTLQNNTEYINLVINFEKNCTIVEYFNLFMYISS